MSAIDTLDKIVNNENLVSYPFKYCLVAADKVPYTIKNELARPNTKEDFCDLFELVNCGVLNLYEGIGISIIESKISAIDVDKCFSTPFDITSADDRAKVALELFKDKAYIEFSFSGKGLRILFVVDNIPNYSDTYYIKNDKTQIEYYQPGNTARYVTLTGRYIYNNSLTIMKDLSVIIEFLNKYMLRPVKTHRTITTINTKDDRTIEELMKKVKSLYLKDIEFQDTWFETDHKGKLLSHIQGKSKESNFDYHLLLLLFNNITQDPDKLRQLFELSPYFKSKDSKHLYKWKYGNYRYFYYMYNYILNEASK